MTDLRAPAGTPETAAWGRGQTVRRRRGLPNGRAIVGGLLMAVAAVGVFSAYTSAAAGPTTRYAVAARDLQPGDRVDAADFTLVAIALPDAQRRHALDSLADLSEATVVEPLLEGELVQGGSLVRTGSATGDRSVSFALDPARAVAGSLRPAERVDILATFGTGEQACTRLVASDVPVVALQDAADSLSAQSGGLTVTVSVTSAQEAADVAHAANAATVTLVRATGAAATQVEQVCTPSIVPAGQ